MLQSSPTIIIKFSRSHIYVLLSRVVWKFVTIPNILKFVIVTALMQNSTNVGPTPTATKHSLNVNFTYVHKNRSCLLDADCAVLSCSFLHTIRKFK